jgi:hypothetical protein
LTKSPHLTDPDLVDDLNADVEEELTDDLGAISVSTRDWTVETIISQIRSNNIDLNPAFQRRNAWNDEKRSKLIESLIWGIPIPQIVLAQSKEKTRSFIVIDGKQRLLTIAGFFDPAIAYWRKAKLSGLTHFHDELDGVDASKLTTDPTYADFHRSLLNADIRCTIISNYDSEDVLYEIFLRMNTGSTKLSTQELRQVLCKGWFANWLIEITSTHQHIHDVLGIEDSDQRLVDVELLLRCISTDLFAITYEGNMKAFLDESMRTVNENFTLADVQKTYARVDRGIVRAQQALGSYGLVGRRVVKGKFEGRFNRALFEVQQFYFSRLPTPINKSAYVGFKQEFINWFDRNSKFRSSIESTTKSIERTESRFKEFGRFFNRFFQTSINSPF